MSTAIPSAMPWGIGAVPIDVEVDLIRRLPALTIVGLPSAAARETADRVRSAITASDLDFPKVRVIANLIPADLRKPSYSFDLPLAVGVLTASEQASADVLKGTAFIGELSLEGSVRGVRGVLPMLRMFDDMESVHTVVVPWDNWGDARIYLESGGTCRVRPAATLLGALAAVGPELPSREPMPPQVRTMDDIAGREQVIETLTEYAETRQPVCLLGRPGAGATMLAARCASLLPGPTERELVDIACAQSVAGILQAHCLAEVQRPFRAPHYTVSKAGLVGAGGSRVSPPGEVTLAHHGVLFLDELPEFSRHPLIKLATALRVEESCQYVGTSVTMHKVRMPARPWLVAAANPCPCGFAGHPHRPCVCSDDMREHYLARLGRALELFGMKTIDLRAGR